MSNSHKVIETFPEDSQFLEHDLRKKRWAVPYHYESLNARVENLIVNNQLAIENRSILDLGCHFGSFAYACLYHKADSVYGIDSEESLIMKANELFEKHQLDVERYQFLNNDVMEFLTAQQENSFDTILCLGLLYYINDPFHLLKLAKKIAKKYIILDTFTAYYGACISKEGDAIFNSTKEETFELPIMIYPFTQADKPDYILQDNFINKKNKKISMLSLPSIPALEYFFQILNLKYTRINWDNYVINNYSWQDFVSNTTKWESHWADVYHTNIRVSYLLEV